MSEVCEKCGQEIKSKTIIIDGWEYDLEDSQVGKCYEELVMREGWELWDYEDCVRFHNDLDLREKLNLGDCWFFIKQPFKHNHNHNYNNDHVARFYADSGRADLVCVGDPTVRDVSLGVFLVRKTGGGK